MGVSCWFNSLFLISVFGSSLYCLFSLLLVQGFPKLIVCFLVSKHKKNFDSLHLVFWFLFVLAFSLEFCIFNVLLSIKKQLSKKGKFQDPQTWKMHKKGHFQKVQLVQLCSQIVFLVVSFKIAVLGENAGFSQQQTPKIQNKVCRKLVQGCVKNCSKVCCATSLDQF